MRFCQLRLNDVIARWPFDERVGALAEARTAPRAANLAADRAKHVGDRLAVQPRIGLFDLLLDAARSGKHDELARGLRQPRRARGDEHERGREQIVVAAVGARADHRLVERDPLARDFLRAETRCPD